MSVYRVPESNALVAVAVRSSDLMGKYEYVLAKETNSRQRVRFTYLGSTMNGSAPLLPQYYPQAQIQKRDPASMNQSMSNAGTSSPAKTGMPLLGPENTLCECPFCNASIKTSVQYSTTSRTHMAAALWCLACCLCCVPYGSDSAKNADHYCPSCHRYLGTYEK